MKKVFQNKSFFTLTILGILPVILLFNLMGFNVSAPAEQRKPNIIMIISDEQNAGIMGCAGDPWVNTPNLDNLAAGGILFDAHYCSSPICAPSRQSLTMGKYVSHHNVWNNGIGCPNDSPSLPRILNESGYESFLVGGMKYNGNNYGFSQYTEEKGVILPNAGGKKNSGKLQPRKRIPAGIFKNNGNALGEEFSPMGAHDQHMETFTDVQRCKDALSFIRQRKETDKPFFLVVGFIAPHYPLEATNDLINKYKGKIPMPEVPKDYISKLPLNYKHLRNERKFENVPDDVKKLARESYYARVEWGDKKVGEVVNAIKNSSFSDNTVIIYTSDHGENLGEHGLWWKNSLYNSSVEVPLIMNWPKRWPGGQKRTKASGSVDLVQTIAEIAEAKTPKNWDGNSMLKWLDNPSSAWKDMAISEYYAGYIASGIAMIRKEDWKYVYHTRADAKHGPEIELYNVQKDPKELLNLANDKKYADKIKVLHAALVKELGEDPEQTEQRWRAGAIPEAPRGIAMH